MLFRSDLNELLDAINDTENDYINQYFQMAGEYRDSVPETAVGLMQKTHELFLDIPDEPGMLGAAFTLLGQYNINIKNIGIIHNREYEEGCLKLVLYDNESAIQAAQIFREHDYVVYQRK